MQVICQDRDLAYQFWSGMTDSTFSMSCPFLGKHQKEKMQTFITGKLFSHKFTIGGKMLRSGSYKNSLANQRPKSLSSSSCIEALSCSCESDSSTTKRHDRESMVCAYYLDRSDSNISCRSIFGEEEEDINVIMYQCENYSSRRLSMIMGKKS